MIYENELYENEQYENEQYENVWRSGNEYFCRTRHNETNQVRIEKIQPKWEYFEKSKDGEFGFILDPSVKLSKKTFTSSKEAKEYRGLMDATNRDVFGGQQPEYGYIRNHFFKNGDKPDIRIWYFDIETMNDDPTDKSFPDPQLADKPVRVMVCH